MKNLPFAIFIIAASITNAWIPRHFNENDLIKSKWHISTAEDRSRLHGRITSQSVVLQSSPFFQPEEEFECGEEEECEINWDLMPGFADEEEETAPKPENQIIFNDDEVDVDMQPRQDFGAKSTTSLDQGRVQLEMNWQINECEADASSCSKTCPDCDGTGKIPCRFCGGRGVVLFGESDFRQCIICSHTSHSGFEECPSCQGTGRIAPWASTMENHMKEKNQEEQNRRFI